MGDFNSHNQIWGRKDTNERSRTIENFMNKNNICLLNNKSPTYLHPATGTHLVIDLTLSDPTIYLDYNWKTNEDNCGTRNRRKKLPCWNVQKAKWEHFKRLCHVNLTPKANINQEDHNIYFTKTLTIAEECMPKSSIQPKFNIPWYNNECKKAVRACCAALRKFKTNPTKENLELFKNCTARAQRTIKESKWETWKNFTSK